MYGSECKPRPSKTANDKEKHKMTKKVPKRPNVPSASCNFSVFRIPKLGLLYCFCTVVVVWSSAFRNVMADMIRREMTKYCRGPSNIPKFTGSDSINSFCWKSVLAELQDTVPTLYKAVNSSMPNKLQNDDREPKYACTMLLYMNLRFILCISRVIFSIYVIIICYLVLIFVCLKLISEK